MRLGFAIAIHARPEILLIDEILSVGDHSFQRKCLERIAQFKAEGCTILIVSHDTAQIREFCDEAIWLNSGRLLLHDSPELVVDKYIAAADAATDQRASIGPANGANRSVQTSS
jgi:lipopolysaccharide transport system ATP-binding protein